MLGSGITCRRPVLRRLLVFQKSGPSSAGREIKLKLPEMDDASKIWNESPAPTSKESITETASTPAIIRSPATMSWSCSDPADGPGTSPGLPDSLSI